MLVIVQGDVVDGEIIEVVDIGVEDQLRCREGLVTAGQLGLHGLDVVLIDVGIVDDVREQARTQAGGLGDEMDEDGILGHVEGDAQAHVAAALDEHAVQTAVSDIPQGLVGTGLKGHVRQIFDVPQGYDHAPVLGIRLQRFQELVDLFVLANLIAIGLANGAVGPHPFVPDVAVHLLQFPHVVALELPDPEDFFNGRLEGDELRRQDGEFFFQIELHDLVGQFIRPHARAVVVEIAVVEDIFDDIQILCIGNAHVCHLKINGYQYKTGWR